MKIPENCKIAFYIGGKEYKRISSARKKAVALSLEKGNAMIRLEEQFTDCNVETSAPFEEYKQGQRIHEHKDYLTEAGKIAYGYI